MLAFGKLGIQEARSLGLETDQARQRIPFTELHDTHALSGARERRDLLYIDADNLGLLGHSHDLLIIVSDHLGSHERTGLGSDIHSEDARSAAALDLVFRKRSLLAVAVGSHDEERRILGILGN